MSSAGLLETRRLPGRFDFRRVINPGPAQGPPGTNAEGDGYHEHQPKQVACRESQLHGVRGCSAAESMGNCPGKSRHGCEGSVFEAFADVQRKTPPDWPRRAVRPDRMVRAGLQRVGRPVVPLAGSLAAGRLDNFPSGGWSSCSVGRAKQVKGGGLTWSRPDSPRA
jgi:hypothetical protein